LMAVVGAGAAGVQLARNRIITMPNEKTNQMGDFFTATSLNVENQVECIQCWASVIRIREKRIPRMTRIVELD